jgi:hypothetical protein
LYSFGPFSAPGALTPPGGTGTLVQGKEGGRTRGFFAAREGDRVGTNASLAEAIFFQKAADVVGPMPVVMYAIWRRDLIALLKIPKSVVNAVP